MDEQKLQDEELDRVSGGQDVDRDPAEKVTCVSCGRQFKPSTGNGSLILVDPGCFKKYQVYYKCPSCGYKWQQ